MTKSFFTPLFLLSFLALTACNILIPSGGNKTDSNFQAGASNPVAVDHKDPALSYSGSTGMAGTVGQAMSVTPSTLSAGEGGTVTSCVISAGGSLPTGLSLNATTCVLSGTPTVAMGTTTFTVTLTNSWTRLTTAALTFQVADVWTDNSNSIIGFGGAQFFGAGWVSTKIKLVADSNCDGDTTQGETSSSNCSELDASWAPQWSDLVAYYKFNNDSWIDAKGSHTGSGVAGSSFSTTRKLGSHAAAFDGSAGHADFPNLSSEITGDYTVQFWVRWDTLANNKKIFQAKNGTPEICAELSSGRLSFFSVVAGSSAGSILSDDPPVANTWYMYTFVMDNAGFNKYLYVNGRLITQGNSGMALPWPNSTLRMGANLNDTQYFDGNVDDFAIWKKALSATDIASIYSRQVATYAGQLNSRVFNAGSGTHAWDGFKWTTSLPFGKELTGDADASSSISASDSESSTNYSSIIDSTTTPPVSKNLMDNIVGLWHLNETTGTTVADSSGAGNAGSLMSGVTLGADGRFNNAVDFAGSGDIQIAGGPTFAARSPFTVSLWLRTNLQNGYHYIIANLDNNSGYAIYLDGGNDAIVFSRTVGGTENGISTNTTKVNDGNWHLATATYDGSNLAFYVDGVYKGAGWFGADTRTMPVNSTFLRLGAATYNGNPVNYFIGSMDEVALWDRALSSDEVIQLYQRGANRVKFQTRICADSTCSTNPRWFGPKGDSLAGNTNVSYFSELDNNTSFNTSADPIGRVKVGAPDLSFSWFTPLTTPTGSYIQYRAILESDDASTNCSGSWCSPDLKSVTIKP